MRSRTVSDHVALAALLLCGFLPTRDVCAGDTARSSVQHRSFRLAQAALHLYARAFQQGEAVYLELLPDSGTTLPPTGPAITFGDYPVRLSRKPWGLRGLFPLSPDEKPGVQPLEVRIPAADTSQRYRFELAVDSAAFEVSHSSMNVGKFSDVNHAKSPDVQKFIAECSAKKAQAFAHHGPDLLSSRLSAPRDQVHITSSFWSSRVYERYKMENGTRVALSPERKIHRGTDFRGARGEPVYAMADGEVVLAEKTYYEGNFVVIDHGNRLMSYYMHQDSLLVSPGQRVSAGQQIGTVGATGVSTAPHLHVSLMIDRIQVDPLSLLPLPVRD